MSICFFVNSDLTVQSGNNLIKNNDDVDEGTLQKWDDRYVHLGRVPFDQRKFRKFEPVIFVEWKAPRVPTRQVRPSTFSRAKLAFLFSVFTEPRFLVFFLFFFVLWWKIQDKVVAFTEFESSFSPKTFLFRFTCCLKGTTLNSFKYIRVSSLSLS